MGFKGRRKSGEVLLDTQDLYSRPLNSHAVLFARGSRQLYDDELELNNTIDSQPTQLKHVGMYR